MIFAALASIFLGAVAAYGQTNIKRLLAYSSINNVGFALVGLAAGGAAGRVVGAVLHGGLRRHDARRVPLRLWMRDANGEPVEDIAALSGLSQTRPAFAAAFAIFMFSLAGIPPLFGFWPKLLVFQAAVNAGLCRAGGRGDRRHRRGRLLLPEDRQGHVHGRGGARLMRAFASRCRVR